MAMSRIARSLAALLVLLGGLVGAPAALWHLGRGFLPDHVPSLQEVWAGATATDTGSLFLGFLVVVGVIAWAVFALCVLLEVVSLLAGRRRAGRPGTVQAAPRIKLLRAPQSAVSALISVALTGTLMFGGAAMASATTPSLHAVAATASVTQSASAVAAPTARIAAPASVPVSSMHTAASTRPVTGGPTWTVARYDTLMSISEATMGDDSHYTEIAKLNIGVPQTDGRTMKTADTLLEIGWKLILPPTAVLPTGHTAPHVGQKTVTVIEGDSVSKIAAAQYGDGDRWPEIAAANHLADPDQLTPGQVLIIPAAAGSGPKHAAPTVIATHTAAATHAVPSHVAASHTARGVAHPHSATPATPHTAAASAPSKAHTAAPRSVAANAPRAPMTAVPSSPAPTSSAGSSPNTVGQTTEQAPSVPTGQHAAAAPHHATPTASPASSEITEMVAGLGAALGALLLAGIAVARRRKGRRRPTGEVPRPVSLSATRVERHLRQRAGGAEVAWMDNALRSAAALSADRSADQLPDVTAVWLSTQELQLQLASEVPAPAPFVAEGAGWVIPAGTELPDRTETAAPFPALVTLGEAAGETFLVDLERVGALTVTGDEQRTANLLRHIAAECSHSLWSDHLQVYLVGWGETVTALQPDRLFYAPSIADVVTILRGRLEEVLEVQAEGATTVLKSRIADQHTVDDPWTPTILLIDAGADEDLEPLTQALQGISGAGRSAVAVVTRTDQIVAGSAAAHIDADGTLQIPSILPAGLRVQAAGLTQPALDELLELFIAAGQFQKPGVVTDTTEPWSTDMSVMGSLIIPTPGTTDVEPTDRADLPEPPADLTLDAEENQVEHQANAGQVVALRPALAAAQQLLAKVRADDVELDADVHEWFSAPDLVDPDAKMDWVLRPRVGVLGPPLVLVRGSKPTDRIHKYTEMVVYLALHRDAEVDQFVADLWPVEGTTSDENRRAYLSRVRTWLGTDPDGRTYLPSRLKLYGLERSRRLLDVELFRRLRKRADAYLKAEDYTRAMTDLCSALDLVRGPTLDQHPRNGYAWSLTNDEADLRDANLMMLETAHLLVDLAIDAGDLDLARQAADAGYTVDHKADLPLVDHMRIAHQVGDDQKARGWLAVLLQANEIELAEDLPNFSTFQAVTEVFPDGLPTAANS